MISLLNPLDNRIVVWGQSCVGKTHFSQLLKTHEYMCFDHLFRWHDIETLGLSCSANLEYIASLMQEHEKCVLDGWHLSDPIGRLIPDGVAIYVLYAPYAQIIEQYRIPVGRFDEHYTMFQKWYEIDPAAFSNKLRFFRNTAGPIVESSLDMFREFRLSESRSL